MTDGLPLLPYNSPPVHGYSIYQLYTCSYLALTQIKYFLHEKFQYFIVLRHWFQFIIGSVNPIKGWKVRGSVPLSVRSHQRLWNQRFNPLEVQSIRDSVPLEVRSHQRFGLIIGSHIRGSVPLQVRALEVRSHQSFGNQRFGHQRFCPVRGSGIRGSVLLEVRELEVQELQVRELVIQSVYPTSIRFPSPHLPISSHTHLPSSPPPPKSSHTNCPPSPNLPISSYPTHPPIPDMKGEDMKGHDLLTRFFQPAPGKYFCSFCDVFWNVSSL